MPFRWVPALALVVPWSILGVPFLLVLGFAAGALGVLLGAAGAFALARWIGRGGDWAWHRFWKSLAVFLFAAPFGFVILGLAAGPPDPDAPPTDSLGLGGGALVVAVLGWPVAAVLAVLARISGARALRDRPSP